MIIGIGVDTVEIDRFANWADLPNTSLTRILTLQEINYCRDKGPHAAASFAVRFAAREAFLKALSSYCQRPLPLLSTAKAVEINRSDHGAPQLDVNWLLLQQTMNLQLPKQIVSHLSLSHTKTLATAFVLLEIP